jgi:hypothetical protein
VQLETRDLRAQIQLYLVQQDQLVHRASKVFREKQARRGYRETRALRGFRVFREM